MVKWDNLALTFTTLFFSFPFFQHTKFNLAPRGFGRSSYRLAEIIQASVNRFDSFDNILVVENYMYVVFIQVGRLPIYIYDVFQWTAYEGTEVAIDEFGFVSQLGQANVLADRLVQVNERIIRLVTSL